MSSQDGSNRSQQNRRTPGQRPADAQRRQNQTWDIDPAEIDRYLSGRPSRAEDAPRRAARGTSGETAEQLSRLQSAVGRRPEQAQPRQPQPSQETTGTYRAQQPRRQRREPEPAAPEYYEDDQWVEETDDLGEASDIYAYDDEPEGSPVQQRGPEPRRPTSQPQARRTRAPRRYEPSPVEYYAEDEYDDELYNDDPYLGYEDDSVDRRPPRTAPPRQRQRPSVSKPNLPKITIPSSISESPLIADRMALIMAGVGLVSLMLMAFIVSDRINLLGDTIPTHVSASGDPEKLRTRDAVWNIPLVAGMVLLMNVVASWFISRIDQFAARFLLASSLLVHFIAWVALFKYLWE